ncbi:hypothetical protein Dsin_012998 [Dipteronia sinensis]|uniref:Uncharacterized protein n=1 Tax=Dipteronia sinensis TaxID=43782 RepID=A0AAE0AJ48_9ROSI|nr:hypothetical protein Dsin_012998 [Dipteronia sinensis]
MIKTKGDKNKWRKDRNKKEEEKKQNTVERGRQKKEHEKKRKREKERIEEKVELLLGKAYSDGGWGIIFKENGRVGDAERMFIQARFFAPENAKV